MTTRRVLLDEHVGRVLEHVLREAGYEALQARDQFGEGSDDAELLSWASEHDIVVLTNNAKDFVALHGDHEHGGMLLYYDQGLPDADPEGSPGRLRPCFSSTDLAGSQTSSSF